MDHYVSKLRCVGRVVDGGSWLAPGGAGQDRCVDEYIRMSAEKASCIADLPAGRGRWWISWKAAGSATLTGPVQSTAGFPGCRPRDARSQGRAEVCDPAGVEKIRYGSRNRIRAAPSGAQENQEGCGAQHSQDWLGHPGLWTSDPIRGRRRSGRTGMAMHRWHAAGISAHSSTAVKRPWHLRDARDSLVCVGPALHPNGVINLSPGSSRSASDGEPLGNGSGKQNDPVRVAENRRLGAALTPALGRFHAGPLFAPPLVRGSWDCGGAGGFPALRRPARVARGRLHTGLWFGPPLAGAWDWEGRPG
jgi:hypothetical protein